MIGKLGRGAALLFLAVMIVAWALSTGKKDNPPPKNNQPIGYLFT